MHTSLSSLINLSNSIVGVSLLTMPYCFQQCGILLSCVALAASASLNKYACHMLIKASMLTRRRKFEYLAYHTLGYNGKLLIELCLICFLLGGCVALFVVAGDILPALTVSVISQESRIYLMVFIGFFVALPLSLRRSTESLTSFSIISMTFYAFLALKMLVDSLPALMSGNWFSQVVWWNTDNLLAILPIFAMSLAGQPQVFEVFDLAGTDIHHMRLCDRTVSSAMQTCLTVYVVVGFCGYISSYEKTPTLPGNSLLLLDDSWSSWMLKFGFLASLIMSFPLCLFPCRTSLHSLIYRRGLKLHEVSSSMHDFIPENRFKLLTILLLFSTLGAALIIPRIELFLGITGATVGCVVCIVAPATIYLGATKKDQAFERISAQFVILIGLVIMALCTCSMMNQVNEHEASRPSDTVGADKLVVVPVTRERKSSHVISQLDSSSPTKTKRTGFAEAQQQRDTDKESLTNKTADSGYRIESNSEQKSPIVQTSNSVLNSNVNKVTRTPPIGQVKDKDSSGPSLTNSNNIAQDTNGSPVDLANNKKNHPIYLLEQIAEVQQEQKKMIEDIQKKLNQGIVLQHEVQPSAQSTRSTRSTAVNKNAEEQTEKKLHQSTGGNIRQPAANVNNNSPLGETLATAQQRPAEFKGRLKVLNRNFIKKLDEFTVHGVADVSNRRNTDAAERPNAIASLANAAAAAQQQEKKPVKLRNESLANQNRLPTSNVAEKAEKAELLSEIANNAEKSIILKGMNNSRKEDKWLKSADVPLKPEAKSKVNKVTVPIAVKMNVANASTKKETIHKEI